MKTIAIADRNYKMYQNGAVGIFNVADLESAQWKKSVPGPLDDESFISTEYAYFTTADGRSHNNVIRRTLNANKPIGYDYELA